MALLKPSTFLVFAVAVNFARAHVAILGGHNHLHPVHSLYVKPSSDGTTGDLYVAATEDSGVKSQWLTEQPLNFLNQYASSLTSGLPDEVVISNQKRAVITSPPIKYTYAMPLSTDSTANAVSSALPYPYTMPAAAPAAATEGSESTEVAATPAAIPYYQHPFYQLYYSQMMAAFANALNNAGAKESSGEEGTSVASVAASATPQTPVWPYSYPVQYVMVDPSAWVKAHAATAAQTVSTTESTTAAASNESS